MHQTASILFKFGSLGLAGFGLACGSPNSSAAADSSGADAGVAVAVGSASGSCNFTISTMTADEAGPGGIPTVGIVSWSVDREVTEARIEFGLPDGGTMTAPVDDAMGPEFRTLLLGMKSSRTYTYRIQVTAGSDSCTSVDQTITTGAVPSAVPRVTRTTGAAAASQAGGFTIGSTAIGGVALGIPGGGPMGAATGDGSGAYAVIVDAEGDPVWWTEAPASCSRAKMSFDGQHMWMVGVNAQSIASDSGEVARVSMDGLTRHGKIPGLSNCHHDLTILPDGRVACLSWSQSSGEQASDLLESDYLGEVTNIATLDSNVYAGNSEAPNGPIGGATYHANSIHYHQADDTYTFGDRNPNVYLKISRAGEPLWQFGGSCAGAKARQCITGDWQVNHGHDLLDDGTFLLFNNGQSGASQALFYQLSEGETFVATRTGAYSPGTSSIVLGDVQRLPNGNTLVSFSTASKMDEIDADGTLVQSMTGLSGYAEWRETLYGAPPRF